MDGTLAVIFLVTSLTDMAFNDCPTGCLAENQQSENLSLQLAKVEFQNDFIGEEILVGYDFDRGFGPYQPTIAASITDQGDAWIGAGAKWSTIDQFGGPFFVETSLLPGIYLHGDGPDIGGALQFRSSFGVGIQLSNGTTVLTSYDHRSNADTRALNPGLETLALRVSIPIK